RAKDPAANGRTLLADQNRFLPGSRLVPVHLSGRGCRSTRLGALARPNEGDLEQGSNVGEGARASPYLAIRNVTSCGPADRRSRGPWPAPEKGWPSMTTSP